MIPLSWYLLLSATLFSIGLIGFVIRRDLIVMLMCLEIMFNAVNIAFASFSYYNSNLTGQIFVLFSIAVAACEAVIGLAIVLALVRNTGINHSDEIVNLRG
ncbi:MULTISPECIES: NADH-quinone oxidoreductase subunit NuoK [Thermodesulfovibrio]|jgi:NADH-quinone oxidoreductase subunit K|uniref:NADH-quinone oxidoreductase subunit K n=1 Tax=Thermodesulfovibrio yellowstonii (strain ATCC 51303 / DSM 11347 / YP87) TaxID=289376 RepID=NUOK_THEYD|nr:MULTISPECIES: NADH-quinone oxidoreductase subunit NuoK [Thermodesulfovibrio]B5YKI9.1 RecName: Full=NADH-quinone oxidoreductase subunit K; AltName: Full=NADH dehydrogenase I subunit K; AltName: Full=NDH-1 subunit K [Thermodesulfovibrio yellowstonii DSM 11347]ACI22118.1 NADH-quinone oxidoreductase chain k [Thermodesulfovibrio yellowstonii DSM 11347]MDI6865638.1 NADH-quinone oxidoreductase subunit NuoK [Thermodesulfovibrio yellowstonii]